MELLEALSKLPFILQIVAIFAWLVIGDVARKVLKRSFTEKYSVWYPAEETLSCLLVLAGPILFIAIGAWQSCFNNGSRTKR